MNTKSTVELFEAGGGEFFTPPSVFVPKLEQIRAILFDWDGVFNDGFKQGEEGSLFSEVDAMGTNLLRYGLWRKHARQAITAIVTGEGNPPAHALAQREHFHGVYSKAKNKAKVLKQFCDTHGLKPEQILFFFDDVLDLEVARQCGARVMITRKATPMLREFTKLNGMVDYLTGCHGGEHGLREGCEMVIGLLGLYESAVKERMTFSQDYQFYLEERQAIETTVEQATD